MQCSKAWRGCHLTFRPVWLYSDYAQLSPSQKWNRLMIFMKVATAIACPSWLLWGAHHSVYVTDTRPVALFNAKRRMRILVTVDDVTGVVAETAWGPPQCKPIPIRELSLTAPASVTSAQTLHSVAVRCAGLRSIPCNTQRNTKTSTAF